MLNNVIKFSFAIIGSITGFTLTRTFFAARYTVVSDDVKTIVFVAVSAACFVLFYSTANKIIDAVLQAADRMERTLQTMTLYELTISAGGLIAGLIVANLVTIPIAKIDIIGLPISIAANILLGCAGIGITLWKKNEPLLDSFRDRKGNKGPHGSIGPKLLDTSVVIDGRILDICRAGFLEGELIVPGFVLEELRHIADSSDPLKRNRGKRGLDVLNLLQKELEHPVRIENLEGGDVGEVDDKLMVVAKRLGGSILTIDYNLNKIASFQGVTVLNVNELANAVKPIALPGEEMTVQVIKDGKENGQGIAYLEDGTMIVVDGGRRHMGEMVSVTVTSILQTAAGRMIFAKPKYSVEKAM